MLGKIVVEPRHAQAPETRAVTERELVIAFKAGERQAYSQANAPGFFI